MNYETFIRQVNGAYRGTDDDAPAEGTPDYILWMDTTNRKIGEWARDSSNTWASLFDIRDVGTVAVGTQTYDLDDEVLFPADHVLVTTLDGQKLRYEINKPQERGRSYRSVYISGHDPQQLTFYDDFIADTQQIGGTISMAGYFIPDQIARSRDILPVDDPSWLIYAVASDLASNDLTYSDKSPDLLAKANDRYRQMSLANRRGTSNNPRVAYTNVQKIYGPNASWYNGRVR